MFDLIDSGNACSLLFLIAILVAVGRQMAGESSNVLKWSARLAATGFLAYLAYGAITFQPATAEDWIGVIIRGLLTAGLTYSIALIVLSVVAFLRHNLLIPLRRPYTQSNSTAPSAQRALDYQRQWEQDDANRKAREQQKVRQEAEAKVDAEEKANAQKRREDARLQCDLLYQRHARELSQSFPRDQFNEFLNRYMSDVHAPEYVEERGKLLEEVIRESLGSGKQQAKFSNLKELANYFENRRKEVDALPYPDDLKDTYRTQINREEDEALRKFLQP
jgi:hypothetical protein